MQQQLNQNAHETHLHGTFEKVKKISVLSSEWKESDKNTKLGFVNYVRSDSDNGLKATRGEGVLNFPITKVREVLQDMSLITTLNKKIKSVETVTKSPKGYKINYVVISPPMGDDRDTLQIHGVFEENGEIYLLGTSIVDDTIKPEVKGRVRAAHYYLLYKLTPQGQTQTKIVFISCLDPKGSFPGFIKDKMNNSRGLETIVNINEYLQKNN